MKILLHVVANTSYAPCSVMNDSICLFRLLKRLFSSGPAVVKRNIIFLGTRVKALTFLPSYSVSEPLTHQIPNNIIFKIDINPFLVKYYFMKFRKFF
jgi:hypothetical protein